MKSAKFFGLFIIVTIALTLFIGLGVKPAHAASIQFTEGQVTSNTAAQENPDLYGDRIVWQDNRNGNWDIYMYSAWINPWNPEIRITTSTGNDVSPKIYDDIIVYQSDRNGNSDIYAYNIATKTETQITDNPARQENPAIDGNRIVWQDNRNGPRDIYMYDLTTQVEQRITNAWDNYNPDISGDIIVFSREATRATSYGTIPLTQICRVVISTGQEILMDQTDRALTADPAIAGGKIVWAHNDGYYGPSGNLNSQWNIRSYNLATGTTWGTTNAAQQTKPDISGEYPYQYIVYQDDRNGNYELYMYQFSNNEEVRVTDNPATQCNPAIFTGEGSNGYSYNSIVFMDYRNGNWDIYLISFGYVQVGWPGSDPVAPEPVTPSLVIGQLQEIKSRIADTSEIPTNDFAGANNKVKENRRNAMINQFDFAIASIEAAVDTQNLQARRTNCQNAIDQLNELINKVDGWTQRGKADTAGSGYTPDWITAPLYLDQIIRSCATDLKTLYNNIS